MLCQTGETESGTLLDLLGTFLRKEVLEGGDGGGLASGGGGRKDDLRQPKYREGRGTWRKGNTGPVSGNTGNVVKEAVVSRTKSGPIP